MRALASMRPGLVPDGSGAGLVFAVRLLVGSVTWVLASAFRLIVLCAGSGFGLLLLFGGLAYPG